MAPPPRWETGFTSEHCTLRGPPYTASQFTTTSGTAPPRRGELDFRSGPDGASPGSPGRTLRPQPLRVRSHVFAVAGNHVLV